MEGTATLDVIGLDSIEQAVYETLVTRQPITVDDLAPTLGVTDDQLTLAVSTLRSKGLISDAPGEPTRLVASPPEIALTALLLDREEQLNRARLEVDKLAVLHQRVASSSADPARLVEVVTGRDAVLRRFAQVQRASQHEIRIIDKPPYVATEPHSNITVEREQSHRGVRYRAIYDPHGLDSFHDLAGDVQASIEAGVEARVLPDTPLKLLLADDRLAMIPLLSAPEEVDSVVIVHPSALLDALSILFEQMWSRALPLIASGDAPVLRTSVDAPSVDDRRLLSLLTAGLPDEAIAKHLNISHRTVQRRLRVLLDRLGVQTRFQAALRSVALGWIPALPAGQPSAVLGQRPTETAVSSRARTPAQPSVLASKAG